MTFGFIIHVCTKHRDLTWVFHLFLFEGTDYPASCVYWLILCALHTILSLCLGNPPFYCSWSLASQLWPVHCSHGSSFPPSFCLSFFVTCLSKCPSFWPKKMLLKLHRFTAFLLLLGHSYKSVPLTIISQYLCFLCFFIYFSHYPFLSKAAA